MRFFLLALLSISLLTGCHKKQLGNSSGTQTREPTSTSAPPGVETKPEVKTEPTSEAKLDSKTESKTETKTEAKHEAKIEPKKDEGCYTFNYQSKELKNPKVFGKNQHLLTLKHSEVNPKSVCVRVNDTPVAFEYLKKDDAPQIILKPILKSHPKITVQYCLRETSCLDKCVVPKDEFMESIGGIAKDFENADKQKVKWDPSQKDDEPDLKKELTGLLDAAPGKDSRKLPVYSDWSRDEGSPSCMSARSETKNRKVASRRGN